MKREYVTPVMESENFVANEYVAACYAVYCTMPSGTFHYVIEETSGNGVPDAGDRYLVDYSVVQQEENRLIDAALNGCNEWHGGIMTDVNPSDYFKANAYVVGATFDENKVPTPDFSKFKPVYAWHHADNDGKTWNDIHVMDPSNDWTYGSRPLAS